MPQVKHIVLLKFRPRTPREEIATIFECLDELAEKIPGLLDVCGGPYHSAEELHRGFTHAFIMTFSDSEARDAYLEHPEHQDVAHLVLQHLEGGLEGVIAFDFEVSDRFRY